MKQGDEVSNPETNTPEVTQAQTNIPGQPVEGTVEKPTTEPTLQQKTGNKWLLPSLIGLVVVALGIAGYFAYQNIQLRNEGPPAPTESPKTPTPTPTVSPYIKTGVYSPITEEDDWGHVTVKQIGNELNAMTPARFTITNLPTTVILSKYMEEENACPELMYRLQDNENYTLFLLLPHVGLRPSTEQTNETITLNGQSFTKTSHFTDNNLTAIYYKSEPLTINHDNTPLEYTWDAYLTADKDIGIDESIASAAEAVIAQVEIKEISDSELSVCQIRQQSQ